MRKKKTWLIGALGLITFITMMTWFFPYSPFSVYKSYSYQAYKVTSSDGSYSTRVANFRDTYEKDLKEDQENEYANVTIVRTEGILTTFEQDWLIHMEKVSFGRKDIGTMLFEVERDKEMLLDLLVQVDYTREQREYLMYCIESFSSIEDGLKELQHEKFASRSELNRRWDNIYVDYLNSFSLYVTFYQSQFLF
ncbi:hypothetical protein [Ornithinibacillus californiensis]|uniref:hypothetical protein n=1 Tax=Ornithinibacillus californiensis TaxID=161536 RepID=UPI00064DDE69|nr:hypothetical protein [Ornithinibacillus californiensis]